MNCSDAGWKLVVHESTFWERKTRMKLAQFKTSESAEQRLGILLGDVVYDIAKLARALKESGGGPPSWQLQASRTQDVINRGDSALRDLGALLSDIQIGAALPLDSI